MKDIYKTKEQLINELSALRKRNAKLEKAENERKQTENALVESEEKFKNLADQSPNMIFIYREGRIVYANRKCEEIMGYTKEEFYASDFDFRTLIASESRDIVDAAHAKHMRGEEVEAYEYTIVSKESKRIDAINAPKVITFAGERAILGIVTDITERKEKEKEIKEARDFLENVIEASKDGIITTDEMGYILSANTASLEMSGFKREDLIGKHASILAVEDKEIQKSVIEKTAELFEKGFATYESQVKHIKNGKITDLECTSSLIKDDKGNNVAAIGIMRDITERKKLEVTLRTSEKKYRSLIENANDAIVSTNEAGEIISFNKKAERMFGYSQDEILGKPITSITHPSRRGLQEKHLEKLKTPHELSGKIREGKTLGKNGQEFPVEVATYAIELHDEYIYTSIMRDISERKEMEHKVIQSEKLKSLGELAGGVAHDFNNVLATILGRAQLLKVTTGPPPDKREKRKSIIELRKGLETIERASLDGAETVRRIQEFARKRDDDKYFTSIDMNKIIEDALEFTKLNWKDSAESKGIKITITKKLSALPSVSGSAAELREVFTNLINNAIFAMPQGGRITVKTFKNGSYACIKVQDTGMGISKAIRDRIFDPFFTTKGPQSSGLGMSVSYGIIERHQGVISVASTEGKGSTFTIEIPFSKEIKQKEKVVPISKGQKKAKILIVEDEEDVRNVLKDILTHEGHRVETASNGKLGIEKFKKNNFDMVLTDLGMPGMSGWQVAEKIKDINEKVPIALITGWSVDLKESEMKQKGIDFIVKKPYKLDQLVNVVQEGITLRDQLKTV